MNPKDSSAKTKHPLSHSGHRKRRIEYVHKHGCEQLSDAELLEMLLFYAVPRIDTREQSEAMLQEHETISNVFKADKDSLAKHKGIKTNATVFFKLVKEAANRMQDSQEQELPLEPARIKQYLIELFREAERETVYALYFEPGGKLVGKQIVHRGKLNEVRFRLRIITEGAIKFGGLFVVLAHNHPSSILVPSEEDIIATKRIAAHLAATDIELVEHYLVGKDDCVGILKMS